MAKIDKFNEFISGEELVLLKMIAVILNPSRYLAKSEGVKFLNRNCHPT